ncbi:hypothetical protein BHE74_00018285 [Ensete ventricosum]|uniref:Uncharacterized protein n=1 Tax=Ensete ventricosum TaxID=4639 RepID=A0A426YZ20_ENSVE|nr:hypothetical protein B296_00019035 [Ensete ventricosum]RWW73803.1 hypothetical protein BHE74_00018285 [Ensete ventricosum]RZR99752.1 hypothetical protein BHM03_00029369 [Ensete ventricosum]
MTPFFVLPPPKNPRSFLEPHVVALACNPTTSSINPLSLHLSILTHGDDGSRLRAGVCHEEAQQREDEDDGRKDGNGG